MQLHVSILILRGCALKLVMSELGLWLWWVSILILRGCALKFGRRYTNPENGCSFNPHFTRMRSEITFILSSCVISHPFQSSFYEDALWNRTLVLCFCFLFSCFNPHFTRMRSEIQILNLSTGRGWSVSILILRGCALKSGKFGNALQFDGVFQSSFYEDALWNLVVTYPDVVRTIRFQSSFYEDALWNLFHG